MLVYNDFSITRVYLLVIRYKHTTCSGVNTSTVSPWNVIKPEALLKLVLTHNIQVDKSVLFNSHSKPPDNSGLIYKGFWKCKSTDHGRQYIGY